MKLKYFIPSLVAVIGALFTSCSEDNTPTYLGNVKVSSSYVAIPQAGGTTTITVNAAENWSIDASSVPEWLTISPMSGSVGESKVSFSAAETEDGNSCEVLLNCGENTQRINVLQFAEETEPVILTVKEAVDMIKAGTQGSKSYYVKGIVCKINEISTSYGNATFFISDDGSFKGDNANELEIYRGLWYNGGAYTDANAFSVGDEIVIKGVLIDYKGTPETQEKNSEVVSLSKSLIKCEYLAIGEEVTDELPVDGGEITAYLTCKTTNGVAVEIPAEAKDWLGVVSSTVGEVPSVTFYAKKNEGGDRSVTVFFKTTDGSKDYTSQATIKQKGAIVTCSSLAEFLAAPVGDTQYRITGVISKVAKAQYGNIYIKDFSGEVYVYGVGAKGDFEALGLKVGDIVTLVGKRGEYNGTAQMTGGQYESHIPVTEVTIEEFLTKPDSKTTYYMVTGTIKSLLDSKGKANDYGNLYMTDGTNDLYVYGCYPGYGATGDNKKFFIAENEIQVGDKLTMIGYKDTYNGLVELCGGICFGFEHAE